MTRLTPFLIDDQSAATQQTALDGFAFAASDVVIGTEGLWDFEAQGGRIDWHADGVHILVRRDGDRVSVGAGHGGYPHLFYWGDGPRWAVSDSFIDLVAHLRDRGVTLTEDIAQTGAFLSRKQAFQQLTTARTPVREIRCLHVDERLETGPTGLSVVAAPPPAPDTYPAALRRFLEVSLGRMMTLRRDPRCALFVHLSGGIDSRAVAAFHVWLARHADLPDTATLHSLTDPAHAADLKIARAVADAADLPLNHLPQRPARALTEDEALDAWRIYSAGVYSPVRIPRRLMNPWDMAFTGHASNGFKIRYTDEMAQRRIGAMARAYAYFGRGDRTRWRAALDAEMGRLTDQTGDIGLAWGRYQRTNRARFHAGQAATYKTQVALFHGRAAARAGALRPRHAADYQFYHDILASLAPDLLDVPFDQARKAPDAASRAALTPVTDLAPVPGRVWGAFPHPPEGASEEPATPALVARLVREIEDGWRDLPRGRVSVLYRWHLWRLRREVRRGRARHPVRLRHLHAAWLLIRLRQLGVRMEPAR